MSERLPTHRLVARNTAVASENKIHDDAVAARLGFTGGLVPGVEVYGYLCHAPLARWGRRWLAGGTASVRFHDPVYDGEEVEVRAEVDDEGVLVAEAHTAAGSRARLAAALLEGEAAERTLVPSIEAAALPSPRPRASLELFAAGPTLGTVRIRCDPDEHREYLDDVGDPDSPTTELGVCHPGWLLRRANQVLVASVQLGPWIHVGSTVQHLRPLALGAELEVRGRVREAFEHKGHRFVELDVTIGDDRGAAVVVDHRAIYEPRQVREDPGR